MAEPTSAATRVTVWTITCRGCGYLLSIGSRLPDDQNDDPDDNEIDVDGEPCNYPFAMQTSPHCVAGAQLPLPFLWSVRTNVEVKPYAGAK